MHLLVVTNKRTDVTSYYVFQSKDALNKKISNLEKQGFSEYDETKSLTIVDFVGTQPDGTLLFVEA